MQVGIAGLGRMGAGMARRAARGGHDVVAWNRTESVTAASITFQLRGPNNTAVPAAVTYDAATRTATLDPSAALAMGTLPGGRIEAPRQVRQHPPGLTTPLLPFDWTEE